MISFIYQNAFQKQWELEADLLEAAKSGDVSTLRGLLERGVDMVPDNVRFWAMCACLCVCMCMTSV